MVALAMITGLVGCRQGVYDASTLPPQLSAVPVINTQALDLSRLSSPATSGDRLVPGDALELTVATGQPDERPQTWPLRIDEEGAIEVPLVGPVRVAGLDPSQAQGTIALASVQRGIYRRPSVSLAVDERRTHRITVVGAVSRPGTYDIPMAQCDLLNAIMSAGGLTEDADATIELRSPARLDGPQLRGPGTTVTQASYETQSPVANSAVTIDLVSATQGHTSVPTLLADGAVITVRKRQQRYVHVMGLVVKPQQLELPPNQDVRLLDAIAMAGGTKLSLADKVLVIRQSPVGMEPAVIKVSINQAKTDGVSNLLLAHGDVVSVEETPTTFLLGTMNRFIRLGLTSSISLF